ncbi:hypothetical protein CTAYLR_001063 [Chrysophaeum taylorii]|uniref:Uncharacterized protein n=1 Tax=Chrysophaeum taylorii TaxID=2483200 RepID=A0AAD7UFM4_9STRA|nr:hypothetical protein CTAYLR_001063 [Chrysophaeum taylorii]
MLLLFLAGVAALQPPAARVVAPTVVTTGTFDPMTSSRPPAVVGAALALAAVLPPDAAMAKGGEYGLCEGRIISFLHPTAMGICFGTTLFAGYTGLKWRRVREVAGELSAAKKEAKAATAALEALEAPDEASTAAVATANALVDTLASEAASLKSGNFRDVHYTLGTVLLGFGIPLAIEGPVNTYMRAGKLFPGPHLYAGAIVVSLWALAAALVPDMQKGKEWARSAHVALNAINVALFAYYQIPTGLEIANKVIQNTKFP